MPLEIPLFKIRIPLLGRFPRFPIVLDFVAVLTCAHRRGCFPVCTFRFFAGSCARHRISLNSTVKQRYPIFEILYKSNSSIGWHPVCPGEFAEEVCKRSLQEKSARECCKGTLHRKQSEHVDQRLPESVMAFSKGSLVCRSTAVQNLAIISLCLSLITK